MSQVILIDSDILIDFSRGMKETAEYLASTLATTNRYPRTDSSVNKKDIFGRRELSLTPKASLSPAFKYADSLTPFKFGDVTNCNLQQLLTLTLPEALERLRQGEMTI